RFRRDYFRKSPFGGRSPGPGETTYPAWVPRGHRSAQRPAPDGKGWEWATEAHASPDAERRRQPVGRGRRARERWTGPQPLSRSVVQPAAVEVVGVAVERTLVALDLRVGGGLEQDLDELPH